METLIIDSSAVLDDVDHHFRVSAGPGSGKTHWLVGHVRQIARVSTRLTPRSLIAVISYTNIAVREIQCRLGTTADVAEVSTIHSFLFRYIVRPYLHFLKDEVGKDQVSHQLVDTHTEHFVARDVLDNWLGQYQRRQLLMRPNELSSLKLRLRALTVRIDEFGEPYFAPCRSEPRDKNIKDLLTPDRLLSYKTQYWQRGQIDHEDVLYFAFRLLKELPALREFLSARFPYLLIDEFQDTLPVQAAVVRWLAENGTTVGVIGDSEQAIYGFLDASPAHFVQFQLPGFRAYSIVGNRRSTSAIVTFLNGIRTDGLIQTPIATETGSPPTVYSGNLFECLMHARSASQHSGTMLVLARKHKNVVRARRPDLVKAAATWDIVDGADPDRSRFLMALAASTDLARRGLFDLAVQRLVQAISSRKHFRSPIKCDKEVNIELRRGVSLSFLEFMVTQHELFITKSTLEVYAALVEYAKLCLDGFSLPKAVKGKFYEEAAKCPYSDLVHGLRTTDETRLTRTIHQAKGSEAESVFIVLDDGEADHILNPQADNEEHRITYVGLSRAKSELFIFCPEQEKLTAFATRELVTIVKGASRVAKVRTRATTKRDKNK